VQENELPDHKGSLTMGKLLRSVRT